MNLLTAIAARAAKDQLPFLVAGGHAVIAHGHPRRVVKDADDVIRLVEANRLDMNDPGVRELFLYMARPTCMKKPDASAALTEPLELEFPDWSGMEPCGDRVSPATAFQLAEQYRAWFPEWARKWDAEKVEKCLIEFVL